MKTYTSRFRFDEGRRFTGVYQQMNRVSLDADWNEEIQLRTTDARRRTDALAEGSPDDGFRITDDLLVDPILSTEDWDPTAHEGRRQISAELSLGRRHPAALPYALQARGQVRLVRRLPGDGFRLNAWRVGGPWNAPPSTVSLSALRFSVRFERPLTVDERQTFALTFADANGDWRLPTGWTVTEEEDGWFTYSITRGRIQAAPGWPGGAAGQRITGWGVTNLPPRTRLWIGDLRGVSPAIDAGTFVIRGGNGTRAGAGRLFVEGHRAWLEGDQLYRAQPDHPDAPAIEDPAEDRHHLVYLDLWEQAITALDDPTLIEPALDGADTTTRTRLNTQVKVLADLTEEASEALGPPVGGTRLNTAIEAGVLPDRYPPPPMDPCRDRCLSTENASTGEGYRGSANLHFRVEVLRGGARPVVGWSRNNASTVAPLTADVADDAQSVQMAPAHTRWFAPGDVVVIEDRRTRMLQGPAPVIRRLAEVDEANGTLRFEAVGPPLNTPTAGADGYEVAAGGPSGRTFAVADRAAVRRWDGIDALISGQRYTLADGITFAFGGSGHRAGDYWTLTARIHAPDGAARGHLDRLENARPHGPRRWRTPLARISMQDEVRVFEDLRRRYLPLNEVRDRLIELDRPEQTPGAFTLVVGDGVRTFGDLDQNTAEGVTGDEAIQAAVTLLGQAGGTIYIRAGQYQLAHPILLSGRSRIRILGDGDATELRVRGAGGAFYVEGCGANGHVGLELMRLVEAPREPIQIGLPEIPVVDEEIPEAPDEADDEGPLLQPGDIFRRREPVGEFLEQMTLRYRGLRPGKGRVGPTVARTLARLRWLQLNNPDTPLDELPEAQGPLEALQQLPHGVITLVDCQQTTVAGCTLSTVEAGDQAIGVLITGTCSDITVVGNHITTPAGVVAQPYAPYLARPFLIRFPRAGLHLDTLHIQGNQMAAPRRAVQGVRIGEGRIDGVVVQDNRIEGYPVGVSLLDRSELRGPAPVGRTLITGNRLTDCAAAGVQVEADGVDIADNEVGLAATDSPLQAGVMVAGRGIRVRGSWITVPTFPASRVFGLCAGVLIGEGVDQGLAGPQAIQDVDVTDNRIEGQGPDSLATGVLIAGPAPAYDLRIQGNVIRQLGGAGVRVVGAGGPVGRMRVEGNRLEGVALTRVPTRIATPAAWRQLRALYAGIRRLIPAGTDVGNPRALLAALLARDTRATRIPLEATLRWVEQASATGGVLLSEVEEAEVVGNAITGVGPADGEAVGAIGGQPRHIGAITGLGGAALTVEQNHIEDVRGGLLEASPAEPAPDPEDHPLLAQVDALGLGAKHAPDVQIHQAAVWLRGLMVRYARGDQAERQRLGLRLYGPLDALAERVTRLDARGRALASHIEDDLAEMRAAQGFDQHTVAAHNTRRTLSRIALYSASHDEARLGWDAAYAFDVALTGTAETLQEGARQVLDQIAGLTAGLPQQVVLARLLRRQTGLVLGADDLAEAQQAGTLVAETLGQVAIQRAALRAARGRIRPGSGLLGGKLTIARNFADRLATEAERLVELNADERPEVIRRLRPSNNVLFSTLAEAEPNLARDLEADFQAVERTRGRVAGHLTRLRGTLSAIRTRYAVAPPPDAPDGERADEDPAVDPDREQAVADAAIIHLFADTLDARFAGLEAETDVESSKRMRALVGQIGQLRTLVGDDEADDRAIASDLAPLVTNARQALIRAIERPEVRGAALAEARGHLKAVGGSVGRLLPRRPTRDPRPPLARRLAALGAMALLLASGDAEIPREALTDRLRRHLDLALLELDVAGAARSAALAAADQVANARGRGLPVAVRSLIQTLVDLVERQVAEDETRSAIHTVAAALSAARTALAPGADPGVRLQEALAELRDARGQGQLTASALASLTRLTEVDELLEALSGLLSRVLAKEAPTVPAPRPPQWPERPGPADGVFAAGVDGLLQITGNTIQGAARGVGIDGGHLLAQGPLTPGLVLEITDNTLGGCALTGLAIQRRTASLTSATITRNRVFACAGLAAPGLEGHDQSAAHLSGSGDLVFQNNVLQGNGHDHDRAMCHEVLIDWRGEVVCRGNTLRHTSGDAGGAGLVVIAEGVSADRVRDLARAPALAVEPPPPPKLWPLLPLQPLPRPGLLPLDLSTLAPTLKLGHDTRLGPMRLKQAKAPITTRALLTAPPPFRVAGASRRLAADFVSRVMPPGLPTFIDLLGRWRPRPMPLPLPPQHRALHIEGNDVLARGPALLVLGEGRDVVSAVISGNTLVTERATGAVYVRRLDALTVTGNRAQCLASVNVMVIRAEQAPISITGNTLVGAEPVLPPPPPRPPAPPSSKGGLVLDVPLGAGAALKVPLDTFKLHGALTRRKQQAAETFAKVMTGGLVVPPPAEEPPLPGENQLRSAGAGAARIFLMAEAEARSAGLRARRVVRADLESLGVDDAPHLAGGAVVIDEPELIRTRRRLRTGLLIQPIILDRAPPDAGGGGAGGGGAGGGGAGGGGAGGGGGLTRLPDAIREHLSGLVSGADDAGWQPQPGEVESLPDFDLPPMDLGEHRPMDGPGVEDGNFSFGARSAALYHLTSTHDNKRESNIKRMVDLLSGHGVGPDEAEGQISALLIANDNDPGRAAQALEEQVLGIKAASPEVRESLVQGSLITDVLADAVFNTKDLLMPEFLPFEPIFPLLPGGGAKTPEPEPPPEPGPFERTLVILGGGQVATVANSTTAGVHVDDPDALVDLNP